MDKRDSKNSDSSRPEQASPWAAAPQLQAGQVTPWDPSLLLSAGRTALMQAVVRPRNREPDRELMAEMRKAPTPISCFICDRIYCPEDGGFCIVVNPARKTKPQHFVKSWFCNRCAEMDNEALLDAAGKSFQDCVRAAGWKLEEARR